MRIEVITTKEVDVNQGEVVDDLKKLNGIPPYDGFNPCHNDGWFAKSLVKKYGVDISVLEKAVGFSKIRNAWDAKRAEIARMTA